MSDRIPLPLLSAIGHDARPPAVDVVLNEHDERTGFIETHS
jgi:hypothetical protein